jgi:hypothetical protein
VLDYTNSEVVPIKKIAGFKPGMEALLVKSTAVELR